MPLYEYSCHRCGTKIEVLQKFSDEPLTVHEDCGGELEKLISRSAFQLKGSGWYATDYPHSSKGGTESSGNGGSESKAEHKSDTKTETKSEGGSDTKSEAKSEAKTESKPAPASADKTP